MQYRIHGSTVNDDEAYIDVTVTNLSLDGTLVFADGHGNEWERSLSWLQKHHENGLVVERPVEDSELWAVLEQLHDTDTVATDSSTSLFRDATHAE